MSVLGLIDGAPTEATFATGDDLASLWEDFASPDASAAAGVEGSGGYGTATVETTLAPGQSRVLSFVLGWAYPHRIARRYEGAMFVGNHYSKRYSHSRQPALETAARMTEIVRDALAWQRLWFDNDMDPLLQDMFVNTFSTWTQGGIWTNFSWEYYENPGSELDFAVMHVSTDDDCRPFLYQTVTKILWQVNHYHSIPRYSFFPELSKSMLTNEYGPAVDTAGCECRRLAVTVARR